MKRLILSLLLLALAASLSAQNPFQAEFDKFVNDTRKEFNDFRNQCNKEFAEFLEAGLESFNSLKGIPQPEEKPVPPVIYDGKENDGENDSPIPFELIDSVPEPEPQPEPVSPIQETPAPIIEDTWFHFSFYNTDFKVRANDDNRVALKSLSPESIADFWLELSGEKFNNMLIDCLNIRSDYQLGDWAYLNFLDTFSNSFLGKPHESTLLTAFLYIQSGYKMRLALSPDNKPYLLYSSSSKIYNLNYYEVDGEAFYPFKCDEERLSIANYSFKDEQAMSLLITKPMDLKEDLSTSRLLTSKKYEVSSYCSVNKNLLDFYDGYPVSFSDNNFVTKWGVYANTPVSQCVRTRLYPQLKDAIDGKSEYEAVSILLDFVQTAFEYGMDDELWGGDRAFFAEETLYYPYCDCEDRSILFSHLVRDLVGLDVLLVYYPGHLATAVKFSGYEPGDYFSLKEGNFIVCDPTYIGAPVGETMPDMDNATAKVLLLPA